MDLSEQNALHWRAVRWYHDWVAGQGPGVPEAVTRQIRRLVGRGQVHPRKEAVTGAGGETDRSRSRLLRYARHDMMKRDVIDTLSLHFGCLDEQVTCSRVKPFLPGLLIPSGQIRIPTPITVHIDLCPDCAEDLKALRRLGLEPEQLERLERLYQARADGLSLSGREQLRLCRRARPCLDAFVQGSLDDLDGAILNHLSTCPKCRPHVYESRQKLCESSPTDETGKDVVCADHIPIAALFDYAVPYDRADNNVAQPPSAGESEGSPPRTVVPPDHVRACRSCLTRIQMLDETLYGVAERTDSGVATVYSTLDDAELAARSEAQKPAGAAELYPDYPIQVQVIRGRSAQIAAQVRSPAQVEAAIQRATCNPQVRFLLKTALAAAAVLLLVFLFRSTGSTSGITFAQVVKAFNKAENVHVSKIRPGTGESTQEFWISRTRNIFVTGTGQESVVYDLREGKKHASQTSGASIDTTELTQRGREYARQMVDSGLGFTRNEIPSGAGWTRAVDNGAEVLGTYELTYSEQIPSGATVFRKLRITVDSVTKRPQEVQRFVRAPGQDEWQGLQTTRVQYLTEEEFRTAIEERHLRGGSGTY